MERLRLKECTFAQGLTFVESLNSFSRIVNHASNIAEVVGTETLAEAVRQWREGKESVQEGTVQP